MSVTVDTNVLLYASDDASPFHSRALELMEGIARGPEIVYLFWPTLVAYLRLSTHPAVFERPLPPDRAMANLDGLLALSHVQSPGERDRFWQIYRDVAEDAGARGNLVPDAHLVSLMVENDVRAIWTHDRDFRRFNGIDVRDPFA